jgi:hypothetical protein
MDSLVPVVDHHLVGLCRVSTDGQDLRLQRDALTLAGCGRIFEEKVSTRRSDRPGLADALGLQPHRPVVAGAPWRVLAACTCRDATTTGSGVRLSSPPVLLATPLFLRTSTSDDEISAATRSLSLPSTS